MLSRHTSKAAGIEEVSDKFLKDMVEVTTLPLINVMRCAIWYYLNNLKNMKNTHGGVLILVKLQASGFNIISVDFP